MSVRDLADGLEVVRQNGAAAGFRIGPSFMFKRHEVGGGLLPFVGSASWAGTFAAGLWTLQVRIGGTWINPAIAAIQPAPAPFLVCRNAQSFTGSQYRYVGISLNPANRVSLYVMPDWTAHLIDTVVEGAQPITSLPAFPLEPTIFFRPGGDIDFPAALRVTANGSTAEFAIKYPAFSQDGGRPQLLGTWTIDGVPDGCAVQLQGRIGGVWHDVGAPLTTVADPDGNLWTGNAPRAERFRYDVSGVGVSTDINISFASQSPLEFL